MYRRALVSSMAVAVHSLPASEPPAGPRRRWQRGQGSPTRVHRPVRSCIQAGRRGQTRREDMIMTQDKARKTAARQRMADTGEPYSVAMRAVQPGQPDPVEAGQDPEGRAASAYTVTPAGLVTTAGGSSTDWDEEYYADGAATEGITVEEFKAREAADRAREAADRAREAADQTPWTEQAPWTTGRASEMAGRAREMAGQASEMAG